MLNIRSAPGEPMQPDVDGSLLVNLADDFDREQVRRGQHVIIDDMQYVIARRRLNRASVRLVLRPLISPVISLEPKAESLNPQVDADA